MTRRLILTIPLCAAGVDATGKSFALASLIDLLLDVPEQSLQFGAPISAFTGCGNHRSAPRFSQWSSLSRPQYHLSGRSVSSGFADVSGLFPPSYGCPLLERMKREFPNLC